VRCPSCGFVTFDDSPECKKCGFDLEAFRRGEPVPKPSLFARIGLKRPAADAAPAKGARKDDFFRDMESTQQATREALARRRDEEVRQRQFLAKERQIRDERARLQQAYGRAYAVDQARIRGKLEELDRDRAELRRQMRDFETQTKAREAELREKFEVEKRAALAEIEKARLLQEQMKAELEEAQRAKHQVQTELQSAAEANAEIQAELARIRRQAEELSHRQTMIETQAVEMEKLQTDMRRLEQERRLLADAMQKLQQERERIDREKHRAARLHRQTDAEVALTPEPEPEPAVEPPRLPIARAEDLLELLGKRRPRDEAPGLEPAPPAAAKSVDVYREEILEELEEVDEAPEDEARVPVAGETSKPAVTPKGGLIFRSAAALIDIALLLLIVGLFLVMGRLVSGVRGGGFWETLAALGLPFYILFVLLAAGYFTYMHGAYGQTLGKRLLGLRLLTTHGKDPGYLLAFFRFVATCFAIGCLGMGIVWLALDPNKQGWHDKLSRTVVIRL
jgi:uncharacterized RDD family membrane protein YckC